MKEIVNNHDFTVESFKIESFIEWKKDTQTWIAYNMNDRNQVFAELIAKILKPGSFEILSFNYEENYKRYIEVFIKRVENEMNTAAICGMLEKGDTLFEVTFDEKDAKKSFIIKILFPNCLIPKGKIFTYQYKFS